MWKMKLNITYLGCFRFSDAISQESMTEGPLAKKHAGDKKLLNKKKIDKKKVLKRL